MFGSLILLAFLYPNSSLAHPQKEILSKEIPAQCQDKNPSFDTAVFCAKKHFYVKGQPVNPKIIQALSGWVPDKEEQIVSLNLLGSQDSNHFFIDTPDPVEKTGNFFKTGYEDRHEKTYFTYTVEGLTDNGVYVVSTCENTGGSAIFNKTLLIRIKEEINAKFPDFFLSCPDQKQKTPMRHDLKFSEKRLIIERIGKISTEDNVPAKVTVDKNTLKIESCDDVILNLES